MDKWQLMQVRGDYEVFLGRDPAGWSVASLAWRPLPDAERVRLGEWARRWVFA
ncbi:MAG TPA: hypothetical protein VMD08_16625 [Candidatus Baltobacteraceae bacterium]|nr:hypothetical protein [Candidatus Baltobacteraceae bacterium]